MTDSEDIQEKAPSHGMPALVLRWFTERPEAVQTGMARVAGTEVDAIVASLREFLEDRDRYCRTSRSGKPCQSATTCVPQVSAHPYRNPAMPPF